MITSDIAIRGGRSIPLKKTVDDAVKKCPSIRKVLVAPRPENGSPPQLGPLDIDLNEACYVLLYEKLL